MFTSAISFRIRAWCTQAPQSRSEPGCAAVYERAFETAHAGTDGCAAHVIALGCGGGEKDAHLLEALSGGANKLLYSPVDVSVAMVLAAREAALKVLGADNCFPVVCDLPGVADWEEILPSVGAQLPRVITFFGMMPALSPAEVLPQLSRLVRPQDLLLLSANLAPGPNYTEGVARVLPQYDNPPMRQWLLGWATDFGLELTGTELRFEVATYKGPPDLARIEARLFFGRERQIEVDGREYRFPAGDSMRLPEPFFVLATQNPIEQEGTYPLPEAQLDRFLFAIRIDYPALEDEVSILRSTTGRETVELSGVVGAAEVLALQETVRDVMVSEPLLRYVAELVRATRPGEEGAPPRIRCWR